MRPGGLLALLVLGSVVGLPATCAAQQVQVTVKGNPPHYAGVPIEITVIAKDFRADSRPTIDVQPPVGGTLDFVGSDDQNSQSIRIVNGRITRKIEVAVLYKYRFRGQKPGTYRIGPFMVQQNSVQRKTRSLTLHLQEVAKSQKLRARLLLPEKPIYIGQRVPVTFEWWLGFEPERVHDYEIHVPLFEASEAFSFIDKPVEREARNTLTIHTSGDPLRLKYTADRRTHNGTPFQVLSVKRTLVPLKSGDFQWPAASVIVDEVLSWRRGGFSDFPFFESARRPARVRKLQGSDLPRKLVVKPVPAVGRPESYAGAVGSGFSLEASADRTVVRVGDPITLTLKVRGDGNLAQAGLPPLTADGGLSPSQFRIPDEDVAGLEKDGIKEFTVTVRVLSESAREIPALAYSWFNPESGTFQTSRSQPIALSVRGHADMVSAEDVVSSSPVNGNATEVSAEGTRPPAESPARPRFTLTGADLSIVRHASLLLSSGAPDPASPQIRLSLYLGPLLLLALAIMSRRRADVDPALLRRRKVLKREQNRIQESAGRVQAEAVREIAAALRSMLREVPQARSSKLESFLGECEAVLYAPEGGTVQPLDLGFHERAVSFAKELVRAGS
ncbi:MAG: BatD family protein [Planctomycetota bacterium]